MKVSIVIPCYNQEEFVADAINSALNQTYKNTEIIIVNDGSTDNSKKVIESFTDNHKTIKFINIEQNCGVIQSRNMAIEASSGEYILPLDADDIIDKTYVEKAVTILNKKQNIGIVYCRAAFFGKKRGLWKLSKFNKTDFLYENCIFCCALFRKSDFIKAGKYKKNMNAGCEDWDLWLSFIEMGLDVYCINEVLFKYRIHSKASRNFQARTNQEWKKSLLQNHIKLYMEDLNFANRIFFNQKKLKKYKSLVFILIVFIFIQFVITIRFLFMLN